MEFFCRDTEVSIWGKRKESLRISVAEMPNARVCSADKARSNWAVTASCDRSPVEQRRTQLSKPGRGEDARQEESAGQ